MTAIPETYDLLIADAAQKYNVPFAWVKGIMWKESSFNPDAYRPERAINDASYGLMQLLLKTARGLGFSGTPDALYDPLINIDLGVKLLGQLIRSYGENLSRVYSAYNSGGPDNYKTNPEVASNVNIVKAHVAEIEQGIYYTGGSENPPADSGSAGWDVMALVLAGIGLVYYFFIRRG